MKTLRIGYNSFVVPANWSVAQLGEFAAKLAELSRIDDTSVELPDGKYATAHYHSPVDVTFSRMDDTVYANRDAARAYLDSLVADQQARGVAKAA